MSRKLSAGAPSPSVASGKVPAPVRARLRRVNCDQAIPYESRMVAATEECLRYCLERIRSFHKHPRVYYGSGYGPYYGGYGFSTAPLYKPVTFRLPGWRY